MSLKIKGWRKIIKWAIWSALAILFLIFLIKVATFEARYYEEKEGSERVVLEEEVVVEPEPEEILEEEEPTEEEVYEYVVEPDRPRYLSIEKIGVNGVRILPMGVNEKGKLATPNNPFDVGWYEGSNKPGQGGTMIIDGHNGSEHVAVGVFRYLPDLVEGDIITVERGDGIIYRYSVVENKAVSIDEADAYMSVAARSPEPGKESVTLITCAGEWSQQRRTYLLRQFVRAVLVE